MFFKALFNSDKIIKEKVKKIQNKKIDILIKSLEKIRESRINLIKDKYSQFHFDNLEINNNNNNNLFHSQKNNKTKAKIKINNFLLPNIIKKINNNLDNNNNENNNKNNFSVGNSLNKIDFNNNNNNNEKRQLTDSNIIIKDNKENNNNNNNNNFDIKFRHKIFDENKKYFNVDINNYNKKKNIFLNYNNTNLNKDYYNPLIYDDFNKRFNTLTYLNFNSLSSRNSNKKNNKIYKIRLTETPEIKTHKKINENLNNNNNNNNYKIINIKLKNIYNKKYKKLFKTLKNY